MKKLVLILIGIWLYGVSLEAQQLPFTSQFSDNKFMSNPAFASPNTDMRVSLFARQQWVGVEGAPRTIFASIEYPFVDYNMSAGAVISSDKTGPVSKTGIQLMYNYKLRELLGRDDQLVIGIQGSFSQFAFNTTNEQYNDINDPYITGNNNSQGFPTVGAGFAYMSGTERFDDESIFYVGAAMQQAYSTNVRVASSNFDRTSHVFFNLGTQIYSYNFMYEPFVSFNYTTPEFLQYSLNFVIEMEDSFWAGLGYTNTSEVNVQGGYIIDDLGNRYAKLKIGALANIFTAPTAASLGPGFEFFLAYTFDMD